MPLIVPHKYDIGPLLMGRYLCATVKLRGSVRVEHESHLKYEYRWQSLNLSMTPYHIAISNCKVLPWWRDISHNIEVIFGTRLGAPFLPIYRYMRLFIIPRSGIPMCVGMHYALGVVG